MVWVQHKEYFQSINDDCNPRTAWLEDFEEELTLWMEEGDHIVIGADLNRDIFHEDITSMFDRHSISNLVYKKYLVEEAPPTYQTTQSSRKVVGLWGTPRRSGGVQVRTA